MRTGSRTDGGDSKVCSGEKQGRRWVSCCSCEYTKEVSGLGKEEEEEEEEEEEYAFYSRGR